MLNVQFLLRAQFWTLRCVWLETGLYCTQQDGGHTCQQRIEKSTDDATVKRWPVIVKHSRM